MFLGDLDVDGNDGTVQIGRAFFSIWDAGVNDTDTIVYNGSKRVLINLNDATLDTNVHNDDLVWINQVKKAKYYSELPNEFQNDITDANYHAGGFFSRIFDDAGIGSLWGLLGNKNYDLGGYSIAHGVIIENATGSDGNDFLIGNEFGNTLTGNGGDDFLHGAAGHDSLYGGVGSDELVGGIGDDFIDGGDGKDTAIYSGNLAEYGIIRNPDTGLIIISHLTGDPSTNDGTDTLKNVEKAHFKDGTVDLSKNEFTLPTDFIFLVDLSGSYDDDLPNFVTSARSIANSLREVDPNSQFAIASFVDFPFSPFGSPGDYIYKADLSLTDSITDFETALAGLYTRDGNDVPEAQWFGKYYASQGLGLNLREFSRKIIFTATDAPAHTAFDYGFELHNLTFALLNGFKDFEKNEGVIYSLEGEDFGIESLSVESLPDTSSSEIIDTASLTTALLFPEIPGPDDTGNGIIPELSTDGTDPLLLELERTFSVTGTTPIFAVTSDVKSDYETVEEFLDRGTTVTLEPDGGNVADAVRLALAEITGEATEVGSDEDDTLTGTDDVQDVLLGGVGNDRIEGLGENDTLDGGSGNDTILGGLGNDLIRGGSDSDILDGGEGNDIIEPGLGIDDITLGSGRDTVRGTINELNGDLIQDFNNDDKIIVLGAEFTDVEVAIVDDENTVFTFSDSFFLNLKGIIDTTNLVLTTSGSGDDVFTNIYINDPPTDITLSATAISENLPVDIILAEFSTIDPDGDTEFTYSLVSGEGDTDNGVFSLNDNQLLGNQSFDFETKNSYSLRVQTDDGNGGILEKVFTITVVDVNEPPTGVNFTSAIELEENTTIEDGIKVTDITIVDDALGTNALSLSGADAESFAIRGTELFYIGASPDFETKAQYQVTVNVDDTTVGATPDAMVDFSLAITNVNEAPQNQAPTAIALSNPVTELEENTVIGDGIKVGDIAVTDDGLGTNALSLSGTDAESFEIRGAELFYIGASPDFETKAQYQVTVNVDDTTVGATPDAMVDFTLAITNVNEAPIVNQPIADQTAQEASVFTLTIPADTFTDPEGNTLFLSAFLEDGTTALPSWLSFNAETLTFSGTPTSDNVGTLTVGVFANDGELTTADAFTITIEPSEPILPSLAVSATDANKDEGNTEATPFTFTVTRSANTSGALTVNYTVVGSGANPASADDFGGSLPSGSVAFADGETEKVVTIEVSGDTTIETDEMFSLTISAEGANITTASAVGTIINDDTIETVLNKDVFRFRTGDASYLFVGDEEKQSIEANFPNFKLEGLGFNLSFEEKDDLIAFNRFQNSDIPGAYLYATEEESASIREIYPQFELEGIGFYAFDSEAGVGTDIYRFNNNGSYIYVAEAERDNILANYSQFVLEGVAFEALV